MYLACFFCCFACTQPSFSHPFMLAMVSCQSPATPAWPLKRTKPDHGCDLVCGLFAYFFDFGQCPGAGSEHGDVGLRLLLFPWPVSATCLCIDLFLSCNRSPWRKTNQTIV